MRPQYTGMKVLQTLACKAGAEGGSEQGLNVPLRPPVRPCQAHLDEFILGVEVGYDDVLAI